MNPPSEPGEEEKVEIRPGVFLDRTLVEVAKISYSSRPSLFMRKLMLEGGLFSLEEIAESSLTGKVSPITKVSRKPLNATKFTALKGKTFW